MNLTRRLFLGRTASAGVVLATVASPVVVEARQKEHPELLTIEALLPTAIAARDAAKQARVDARSRFAEIAPALPDSLIFSRKDRTGEGLTERETDCEGRFVYPENVDGKARAQRRIYSAHQIQLSHGFHMNTGRYPDSLRMKHLHDTALAYEAAYAEAVEAAGIMAALHAWETAVTTLRQLAARAADVAPHSLTGLVIKARTLKAYADCGEDGPWSTGYSAGLPGEVLALFGEAVTL